MWQARSVGLLVQRESVDIKLCLYYSSFLIVTAKLGLVLSGSCMCITVLFCCKSTNVYVAHTVKIAHAIQPHPVSCDLAPYWLIDMGGGALSCSVNVMS